MRRKGGACAQPTIAKCLVETRDSVTVGQVETHKTALVFFFLGFKVVLDVSFFFRLFF